MRNSTTLQENFVKIVRQRIHEYEQIKAGIHPRFKFVTDFYQANNLKRQNFIKYYNRFKSMSTDVSLLPQKRGRKYGTLKTHPLIQRKIQELRGQGFGKYDIYDILLPRYGRFTPSISTIYNILKRYGINKPDEYLKQQKRRYVKEKIGELGHIDCHYIQKGTIGEEGKRYYLVSLVDDHTRLAWSIRVESIKGFVVASAVLKLASMFKATYGITFKKILSDNGSEFKGEATQHIYQELGISAHFTRPYRPQTNGKVERFWRSIEDELLRETVYETGESFDEELFGYCVYYNHIRKHYGIKRQTPFMQLLVSKNS